MKKEIEKKCANCSTLNIIYEVDTLLINECRNCASSLNPFGKKLKIDDIMELAYPEGYPDVVPVSCGNCTYFTKLLGMQNGMCDFYNEQVYTDWECIVTKIQKKLPESMIPCPQCGIEQNEDAVFCAECGTEINPKVFVKVAHCDKCDDNFPIEKKFCEKDGNKLKTIEVEEGSEFQVSDIKSEELDEEIVETVTSDADVELPMKWYKFVTYVMCPLGIIGMIVLILGLSDYVDDIITFYVLFDALLIGILMLGLHNKTAWSWKLLLGLYIINSLFGRIEALDEWGPFVYLIFVIIVNAFTTYPNYIYFNKRKHLFVN